MRHRHHSHIKYKAENKDTVVFFLGDNKSWIKQSQGSTIHFSEDTDYFLCHPKNEKLCRDWLNKKTQVFWGPEKEPVPFPDKHLDDPSLMTLWVNPDADLHIKESVEFWVAIGKTSKMMMPNWFSTKGDAQREYGTNNYNFRKFTYEI